jgi:hypothetical protein
MVEETNIEVVAEPVAKDVHAGGRPTKIDVGVVALLIQAFCMGWSDTQACIFAEIDRSTYYRHMKTDPEFSNKINKAKQNILTLSTNAIFKLLSDPKTDYSTLAKVSMWGAERKDPEALGRPIQVIGQQNVQNNYLYKTPGEFIEAVKVQVEKEEKEEKERKLGATKIVEGTVVENGS